MGSLKLEDPIVGAQQQHPLAEQRVSISVTQRALCYLENSPLPCVPHWRREEKSARELSKFKLANFLMEIAVTPEWSCLELKHCCNQYRLSWAWRARTFRSPFVKIMEKTVCYFFIYFFFPDMLQTSRYGRGIAGYDAGSGKQIQRGAFYQETSSSTPFEAVGSS